MGTVKLSDFYVGPDHTRQVAGWHEKSGGEHVEHIEFIVLLSFCYILGIIVVFDLRLK